MDIEKKPLGYITLLNNMQKAVYPMDDFFINYTFNKEENWGHLRDILNIFLDAYAKKYNRQDGFHFVDEHVIVETQYEHYMQKTTKQPVQDIRINETQEGNLTYIEFQNKRVSKPPISIRASNYSGLAINKAEDGSKVSQVWLLAENDDQVLCGRPITNFRMVEDNTGEYYPREVNIMFMSLPRLAAEENLCGGLSQLLMGMVPGGGHDELKVIQEMFARECENFKENEEVIKSMTILEERYAEGRIEGKTEGRTEGRLERDMEIALKLFSSKRNIAQVTESLRELGISDEIIKAAHRHTGGC